MQGMDGGDGVRSGLILMVQKRRAVRTKLLTSPAGYVLGLFRWRPARRAAILVSVDDRLDTALTHVSTIYGLYVTQRQNVVNFYLAGIALLSVAYATAIDKGRAPVAVAVCALAVLASAVAYLHHRRHRDMMRIAEKALCKLQAQLATELHVESLKIQEAIQCCVERRRWPRREQLVAVYCAVALVFVLGAIYAAVTH